MDQNILFRWIWRLNGLLLLVALSAIVFLVGPRIWQGFEGGTAIYGPYGKTSPGSSSDTYGLFLDDTRPGRRETVLVLARSYQQAMPTQDGSVTYEPTPDLTHVANYLFMDPATGSERWLFPTNNQTITSTDYVYDSPLLPYGAPPLGRTALAVLYNVKPDAKDAKYQVYASKLDGSHLTKLLDGLDRAPGTISNGETISVRYMSGGRMVVAIFSVADFKQLVAKDVTDKSHK